MLDKLITAGIGAGLMGVMYLAWLMSGAFNVAYDEKRVWSWRRFLEDLLKLLLRLGGVALYIIGCELVEWYASRLGADITAIMNDIGSAGVIMLVFKATMGYAEKAFANFAGFLSQQHNPNLTIEIDPDEIDWSGISADVKAGFKKVADALTPEHLQNDTPTEMQAEPSAEEVEEALEGLGAGVSPLARRLPDGDNDGGKGWQCSKYAYFLATGIRMNHKPHPDYGPCNGNAMVDYLIRNYGFVECEKQDGAIFSYNTGQYGHTGAVLDAKNNLVNDANWTPLRVGTHYLNLDAVGARYCCLPGQKMSTTTSAAKPTQTAVEKPIATTKKPVISTDPNTGKTYVDKPLLYHKGEMVRPLRKVDYDGRHLRQYDDKYYVVQDVPEGCDRVVLGARGQIWAAMRIGDVEKI